MAIRWRAWRGKEDPQRLRERLGLSEISRPPFMLIWFHAASLGESIALLPLIERFCKDTTAIVLLTTGTLTSARIMADRLPNGAIHQFAPWDRSTWIGRFLDHWRPDLAVRMESELWPNTLTALNKRHIPVAVINARLSGESIRRWARIPVMARSIFSGLDLVIAQTNDFAAAFKHFGTKHVQVAPNLKLTATPLPVDPKLLMGLKRELNDRPVWLAASTHLGEEEIAIDVHKVVARDIPDLVTIIVPRHPERGDKIVESIRMAGLNVSQRSLDAPIDPTTEIYIADTLGELGLFYSLAPIVFIGKSLAASGGQNPIEPAHFGCAILFGIHMENFQDLAEAMLESGMAEQVSDCHTLAHSVKMLMSDDVRRNALSKTAATIAESGSESIDQTFNALIDLTNGLDNKSMDRYGR
ncbi:MAG: 3-deoxy-D-manno-octulosonic acid transferase [Rhodospirillaceae bacterium]